MDSYPQSHSTLGSLGFASSCKKLKPLNVQYNSLYDKKTWLDGTLPQVTPIHKVTQPISH